MISFVSTFTSVTVSSPDPPVLRVLPAVTFEERFERDGRWLLGPQIIASVARHFRGKSMVAKRGGAIYEVTITLPEMPKVLNKIDDEYVDIFWSIPEELRTAFRTCYFEVFEVLADDIDQVTAEFLGTSMTDFNIGNINAMLREFENRRTAIGEPQLWQIFAERCGIEPWAVASMSRPFANMRED